MRTWRGRIRTGSLLLAVLLPLAVPVSADTASNEEALRQLRQRQQTLRREMAATRNQRDAAREALRPFDQRVNEQTRKLRRTRATLRQARRRLAALKSRRHTTHARLATQRRELGAHARAAYTLGRQDYLKLLLNQQNPAAFNRVMTYYRYFTASRVSRIRALNLDLVELSQLARQIEKRSRALETIEHKREQETAVLAQSRRQRAVLLASLNRELQRQGRQLQQLQRDQRRLQNLVEGLPSIVTVPGKDGGFRNQRGRLPLPVRGRVAARFGARRAIGDLRWKGIFLATPDQREVKSVFGGKVVFSDWMPGYGLLLILEHGNGYMTLYGNNESLFPAVGDRVEAGQVIAVTGNTGNLAGNGLYFEVRHQGKPRDPLRWCRRG